MKKIICTLLALVLALSAAVGLAGDDFILRGGVRFGEEQGAVEAKETWTPVEGPHFFAYTGSLMQIPGMVSYGYDSLSDTDGNGLKRVMYCVGTVYNEDGTTRYSRNSNYGDLLMALSMKYGMPAFDAEPEYTDPGMVFYSLYLQQAAGNGADFESISQDCDRAVWVIPCSGYRVMIDLREYDVVQNGESRRLTLLEYCAYTEEDIQAVNEVCNEL